MNHSLDLELIQRPAFAISSWSWYGMSILIGGLVLAVFTWKDYQIKQSALMEISGKLSQLSQQSQHKKMPVISVVEMISPEKKLQIKTTVSALTMPWGDLLLAIEQSDTQDIALLSLNPNSKKQQLSLSGEAKSLQSVLNYIQKLEAQPMLEQAYLQKHSIDEANVSKPVKFTIAAQWHSVEEQ